MPTLDRRLLRLAACLLVSSVMAASSVPAAAEDKAESERLIREGLELRRQGRDEAALPKFREAHERAGTPRAAAQLGFCYQALGRWTMAEELLSTALAAKADPWVRRNAAAIAESLDAARAHIGRVEVLGSPEGAEVLVNGRKVGTLPLPGPLRVDAGNADIEVHAPGHETASRSLTVEAGQYQSVVLRLTPIREEPPAPPALPEVVAQRPASEPTNVAILTAPPPRATEPERPVWKKPWFWIVTGAVVVAGVTAGIVLTRPEYLHAGGRVDL